jgi:hypothetical protein
MAIDEEQLRLMLERRSKRTSLAGVAGSARIATSTPQTTSGLRRFFERARVATSFSLVLVVTVAIALVAVSVRRGSDVGIGPVGLYQSEAPVGTGAVGANTCVALRLTDDAYRSGTVTVWWWLKGSHGCASSTSGIVAATARLAAVQLRADGGVPNRTGHRVDLDLQLVPSGSEMVTFTLDSARANPGQAMPAYKGVGSGGQPFQLTAMSSLSVDEPGTTSPPTPRQP